MSVTPRRVVLTGIGALTPLGAGAAPFWDGLAAGHSGIRMIQSFDAQALPTRFAGELPDFDPKAYIDKKERKSLRVMARTIQIGVAAAQLAMDDARLAKGQLDPTRFGVEFGAGLIASELLELGPAAQVSASGTPGRVDLQVWGEQGLANIPPLWMLKYLPNMPACHVSILHDAQGPSNSVTESEVAGLLALAEAARIVRRDQADVMLVGGADSKVNPLSMVRQSLFGHLSRRNETPDQACRPFDRDRDGLVIGEGGAVLIAEELSHAQKRGATIYGELLGCGSAFDRGLTGKGLAQAIRAALEQGQVRPDQIDHVNAHGLGTVSHDAWESRALREVFGTRSKPVPVWAVKSYIGNLGAGSGTVELAASLLALRHGSVPGTRNFATPDPACPVAVSAAARPIESPYFLKVGYTEMGQCAAVVCRKWE